MSGWIDRHLVKAALSELADRRYHTALWLGAASAGEIGSFEEAVSRLFDDSGLGDRLGDPDSPVFDRAVDGELRALDTLISKIPVVGRDPAELISDRRVNEVVESATAALCAIVRLEADEAYASGADSV